MTPLITVLKALSDETRFRLLKLLLGEALCGRALAKRLGISEAAVSQHVKVLREAGLVEGEKRGYWMHYSVQRSVLKEIIGELDRLADGPVAPTGPSLNLHAVEKDRHGKQVKTICCGACSECSQKLREKPGNRTHEPIGDCHGDLEKHPCEGEKKGGNEKDHGGRVISPGLRGLDPFGESQ